MPLVTKANRTYNTSNSCNTMVLEIHNYTGSSLLHQLNEFELAMKIWLGVSSVQSDRGNPFLLQELGATHPLEVRIAARSILSRANYHSWWDINPRSGHSRHRPRSFSR